MAGPARAGVACGGGCGAHWRARAARAGPYDIKDRRGQEFECPRGGKLELRAWERTRKSEHVQTRISIFFVAELSFSL